MVYGFLFLIGLRIDGVVQGEWQVTSFSCPGGDGCRSWKFWCFLKTNAPPSSGRWQSTVDPDRPVCQALSYPLPCLDGVIAQPPLPKEARASLRDSRHPLGNCGRKAKRTTSKLEAWPRT